MHVVEGGGSRDGVQERRKRGGGEVGCVRVRDELLNRGHRARVVFPWLVDWGGLADVVVSRGRRLVGHLLRRVHREALEARFFFVEELLQQDREARELVHRFA